MHRNIEELRRKIDFWSLYVKQHRKMYAGRKMPQAWHKRIFKINERILDWRIEEVEMVRKNPSLYKRKSTLIENLYCQMEFHKCQKEHAIRKYYSRLDESVDYGLVDHHQREMLLILEEIHFEFLKAA